MNTSAAVQAIPALPVQRPRIIEVQSVGQTYRAADGLAVKAVDSVSLDIVEGEFLSILGPSGCGKSTLLMMISGLLTPTQGHIRFKGQDVSGPVGDFGIVFQDAVLFPWRTVRANIELPGEITGLSRSERRDRAQAMIELVKLTGFENKYPKELSGGMQQRVAIARALTLRPSLLLMDEPFGALDAMTREQMNVEIQRISLESKATVVFVTHSIAEAAFLSDRVVVMTGRPSRIQDIVTIDIPRPRSLAMITSDAFGAYVGQLRQGLNVNEEL